MAPTRILYVLDELHDPDAGGTERHLTELLTRLDPRRFEPEVAVFRSRRAVERAPALPCPVRLLDIRKLAHPATALTLLRLAGRIRSEGIRLVHVYLNDASVVAPPFCRLGGARVVVSRRDMGFWYTPALLALLRVSNRFVTRMVVNSDAVRLNVHRQEGCPLETVKVLPNGVDLGRFDRPPLDGFRAAHGIGPDDPVIGMVAHFHAWKRHADLVRAFALVRRDHPRAHLVFVGAGRQQGAVRALCDESLQRSVHFVGAVADPVPIVRHFSAGVLCSDSEGSSNVVLEYAACGLPVVCTNVGGNAELIEEGVHGRLIAPGDVAGLARALTGLLSDPVRAAAMGRRARAVAERRAASAMAERHMALYEELVRGGARPC